MTCEAHVEPISAREARARGAAVLRTGEIRLCLVGLLILSLTFCVAGEYALLSPGTALMLWAEATGWPWAFLLAPILSIVLELGAVLFLGPIFCAVIPTAVALQKEGATGFGELFGNFSSGDRFARSLSWTWGVIWRLCVCLVLPVIWIPLWQGLAELFPDFAVFIWVLGVLPIFLTVVAELYCLGGQFLTPWLMAACPEKSAIECRSLSRRLTKGYKWQILRFHTRMILGAVWGLLTVGIVLILHSLPLWLTSYTAYAGSFFPVSDSDNNNGGIDNE